MYKLKIVDVECKSRAIQYYTNLQEVARAITNFSKAENLAELLNFQKECNLRFYISYKNN